ncbi:hypothetical protein [Paraburkholderia sp. GAS33]|uniref:hypothetical protein n=1 Tax=Paraburkholderia sp. GAS33 TaxID=3035130 RepID=UPI003D1E4515
MSFDFSFPVPLASELYVYYTDVNGSVTLLAQNSYSTTGIGTPDGGSVTYPLSGSPIASGTSLTIERIVPLQQLTSLVYQSGYYPNVVEKALDLLTMICQQLANQMQLSLQVPIGVTAVDLVLPGVTGRANTLVGFDSNGNAITYPVTASVGAGNMQDFTFLSGSGFTGGVTTQLTLPVAPGSNANIAPYFDGLFQFGATVSGDVVTFPSPIPFGTQEVLIRVGTSLSVGTPTNGTVGAPQLEFAISGTTAQRPATAPDGWSYLDHSLSAYGTPITKAALSPTGWVNSTGAQI